MPASVGPDQGFPGPLVVSLDHEKLCSSSASDVPMSLSVANQAVTLHLAHTTAWPGFVPLVAPQLSPIMGQFGGAPHVFTQLGAPLVAAPPPVAQVMHPAKPLKLCKLKDAKAFIGNFELIQYYLHISDFSTGRADDALITDSSNLAASCMWKRQLCLADKDGKLWFVFKNNGNLYNDCGFEMLAALTQHCHPNSVANAFTSLLSLFNDVQGNNKPILQYWSCFDGIIVELSWCKVAIPHILLVLLFLHAIHSRYSDLLEMFCTHFKSVETATIDSIVGNIEYHDGFTVHKRKGTKPPASATCVPAAMSANTDKKGTVWNLPFEWLSKSYCQKGIKTQWTQAMVGTGIYLICHCKEKPWHVPNLCPLLQELNLNLEVLPSKPLAQPSVQSTTMPLPLSPTHGPSPGGRVATTDDSLVGGSLRLGSALTLSPQVNLENSMC